MHCISYTEDVQYSTEAYALLPDYDMYICIQLPANPTDLQNPRKNATGFPFALNKVPTCTVDLHTVHHKAEGIAWFLS